MDLLQYFLISIVVYLGLVIGIVLSFIAKNEVNIGRKYLFLLQKAIITLIFIFLFYFLNLSVYINLLFSIIIFLVLLYLKNLKSIYIYALFGLLFWISSKNINFFIINSILIFLYGFPVGSLAKRIEKRSIAYILITNILFIIIALLLYFIP